MSSKYIKIFTAVAIIMVVSILLASGSSVLEIPVWNDPLIPLGNILTWMALLSWTLFFSWVIPSQMKLIRILLGAWIALALFWPMVGYFLAGNGTFAFDSNAGMAKFMTYTGMIVVLPLLTASLSLSLALMKRLQQKPRPRP